MSPARDLPARPSLDSLRKQAKKLARDAAAGSGDAIARVHAQLPHATLPLSNRDAQLVIAREYGFAGWTDLTSEVEKRLGRALDRAAAQAKVAIHDHDHERLRALLADYPALVSWRNENGDSLSAAIMPYALDVSDPERERLYCRPVAAEVLIDAGVVIERPTWEYLIRTGASGMLQLLARKQALPMNLPVLAALGDEEAVRARLEEPAVRDDDGALDGRALESGGGDAAQAERIAIGRALLSACRFKHAGVARRLLDRSIELDPELGRRVDRWQGREAFLQYLIQHPGSVEETPWQAFVTRQLTRAIDADDMAAFHRWLEQEPWVLEPSSVELQARLIGQVCWLRGRGHFISALLEKDPALLRTQPPPASPNIQWALSYGNAQLVPLLTRIWPLPDDLPHAAGTGDTARVARWFDVDGRPVLGPLERHYPSEDPKRADLGWGAVTTQMVLDVALAWAVLNGHFEIASFLLERGADVDTDWATHEPASILHEAAIQGNEEAVRFLIDHGADLTIKDHRYRSTAEGWARYGSHDERMAELLAAAAEERTRDSS